MVNAPRRAAAQRADKAIAESLRQAYVAHLRKDDFRLGDNHGGPWECEHPDHGHHQNPIYLASVAVPLAIFEQFSAAR